MKSRLELVRSTFDAFNANASELPDVWSDGAEIWTAPGFPERGPFKGRDEIRGFFQGLREGWQAGSTVTLLDLEEIGERVIATFEWRAVGETSGVETSSTWLGVYDFSGDGISRLEYFTDRDLAVAAAERPGRETKA